MPLRKICIAAVLGVAAGTPESLINHTISLGTCCTVGLIVYPAVWWVARIFQRFVDRIESMERSVANLPCRRGQGIANINSSPPCFVQPVIPRS